MQSPTDGGLSVDGTRVTQPMMYALHYRIARSNTAIGVSAVSGMTYF